MNYLKYLPKSANHKAIETIHSERQAWVNQDKKGFLRYRTPFMILASFAEEHLDFF